MAEPTDLLQTAAQEDIGRGSSSQSLPGIALPGTAMVGTGLGVALAPTLVLAGAAADTMGAAALTSGLAAFGGGTMMGGVANLGLLGGALGVTLIWSLVRNEKAKVKWSVIGCSAAGAVVGAGVSIGLVTACAAAGTGGAAVITSGLAALGGGAIAAGGLGIAGGIAVCTGVGAGLAILFGLVAFGIWWYLGQTGTESDDPTEDSFFNAACDALHIKLSTDDIVEDGTVQPHEKLILKPRAPAFLDFGSFLSRWKSWKCSSCQKSISDVGCSVCKQHFCLECFPDHRSSCSAELNLRYHLAFVAAQAQEQNKDHDPSTDGCVAIEMPGRAERRSILRSGTVAILAEVHKQLKEVDAKQPWYKFWTRRGSSLIRRILRLQALQLILSAVMDPDDTSADNVALVQGFAMPFVHLTSEGSKLFCTPYALMLCAGLEMFCEKTKYFTESVTLEYARAFLKLQNGASPQEIKSAYKRLSKRMHPDTAVRAGWTEDMCDGANALQSYLSVAKEKLLQKAAHDSRHDLLALSDGMESHHAELQEADVLQQEATAEEFSDGMESHHVESQAAEGDVQSQAAEVLQREATDELSPLGWMRRLRLQYIGLQHAIDNDSHRLREHFALDNLRVQFEAELHKVEEEKRMQDALRRLLSIWSFIARAARRGNMDNAEQMAEEEMKFKAEEATSVNAARTNQGMVQETFCEIAEKIAKTMLVESESTTPQESRGSIPPQSKTGMEYKQPQLMGESCKEGLTLHSFQRSDKFDFKTSSETGSVIGEAVVELSSHHACGSTPHQELEVETRSCNTSAMASGNFDGAHTDRPLTHKEKQKLRSKNRKRSKKQYNAAMREIPDIIDPTHINCNRQVEEDEGSLISIPHTATAYAEDASMEAAFVVERTPCLRRAP